MNGPKKIALVTGGYSGEAVISYKSATTIFNHLDKSKYNVYVIDVTKDGWYYKADNGELFAVDKNDFSISVNNHKVTFDCVFIGMHGTPGEDGKLQGYFDVLGLPYTSCNAATSAITFNKRYTVAVAAFAGINVAKSVHLFKQQPFDINQFNLKLPVFVKPNNGGSSIGMSKVSKTEDIAVAIEKAFAEDNQVLVEEMITGREFTIGVFKHKGEIVAMPMTEVKAHADMEFFDFIAKYQGKSTEITPAEASDEMYKKVSDTAKKVYAVFNCSGVIRIDFIYNEERNEPFMLEINTIPGQSDASIVPQQVKAMGWKLEDFYASLIEEALADAAVK
ncbi:D-alanine-D-alanine ligase [Lacibacter cauensis]|uniref:D-alanine--D-alanine ligase n=1 Tax=Lacibacter cauensis TaxID=510947 RepID=A0A562SHM7_9BACT|nr:D-alanine--D-alanine ligase [Lacibacter cauensis]TWI80296.1 D-alanine-D-alanine ligase [Lacibacter cauensis]